MAKPKIKVKVRIRAWKAMERDGEYVRSQHICLGFGDNETQLFWGSHRNICGTIVEITYDRTIGWWQGDATPDKYGGKFWVHPLMIIPSHRSRLNEKD